MRRIAEHFLAMLPLALLLHACNPELTPKPRGYFRIDLPEQRYSQWEEAGILKAEIPAYAVVRESRRSEGSRWYDLRFSDQRATVHLTWSPVNGQLDAIINDAHTFKDKHGEKATRIQSERMLRDSSRVFGTLFDVEGDVASPFVFYLTDSTDNFLYGALYFDSRPNADSLGPVTERIRADLRHLAGTLEWIE
jgi:gliding motility-associated lipoprotein GldD